jgi:hypothetical protein
MYKVKANVESPLVDGSLVYRIFFEVGFSTRTGVSGSVGRENVLEMKLPSAAKTYWTREDAIMQLRLDIKTQPRKKEAIWGKPGWAENSLADGFSKPGSLKVCLPGMATGRFEN